MITDDIQAYKGVATDLRRVIIHVRHIHSPPYERIVVDMIVHRGNEFITHDYVAIFDILL